MKPRKRTNATTQKSHESTESTSSDSSNSGAPSNTAVREFLYLDYPKLTSYYAQLFAGARKDFTHTLSASKEEAASSPQTTQQFEGTVSASTGESDSIARMLGLMADVQLKVTRLIESGHTSTGRIEAEVTAETTELHHDILRRVEDALAAADLIETNTAMKASTRPFYRVAGRAAIMVLDDFVRHVEENEALNRALEGLGHQSAGEIDNAEHLNYILKRFYASDIGVVVSTRASAVSASLDSRYLQAPIRHIINAYGRVTQVPITILGLRARDSAPSTQKPITLGNFVSDLPKALLKVNDSLHAMDNVYQLRADLHLFPIAIYVDPVAR